MPRTKGSRNKPKRPTTSSRRKRVKKSPFGKSGGFKINRLFPAFGITKGATSGLITSGNTNCLEFGTPVLSVNGITGFYDVPFAFTFRLDQLQGYADLTSIADKFKIQRAYITIHGGNNAAAVGSNMPWIEYVEDVDDATVPSIASIREKMGVRNKGFNQQGKLTLPVNKLRVASSVYSGGITSAYMQTSKPVWVDMAYPAVPHYGLKGVLRAVYLDGSNNSNQMIVDVKLQVVCADLQ